MFKNKKLPDKFVYELGWDGNSLSVMEKFIEEQGYMSEYQFFKMKLRDGLLERVGLPTGALHKNDPKYNEKQTYTKSEVFVDNMKLSAYNFIKAFMHQE